MENDARLAVLETTVGALKEQLTKIDAKLDAALKPASQNDWITRTLFSLVGALAGLISGVGGSAALAETPPPKIQYVPAPPDLQAPPGWDWETRRGK